MKKRIETDIRKVLKGVRKALDTKDTERITRLSNHTIHNASVYQDEFSLTCAVVVYAIGKLLIRSSQRQTVLSPLIKHVDLLIASLHDETAFQQALQKTTTHIKRLDSRYKHYVEEVIHKARVKKGGALYKHGISMGQAADLLGLSRWDIQNYIGHMKIADLEEQRVHLQKRLNTVRKVFV